MTAAVLCFSVDDGHPLDMRMADLLIKHGVQASFFVPSRNSEGQPVLPPSALRDLSGKFEIGSHTLEHRYLNRLDMHEALRQITEGKRALQDTLGKPVHGFCYPGGKYRALHCGMVQAAGFRYARTTQNLRLDVECSPLELPTTLQFYPHPRAILIRNFISQRHWQHRLQTLELLLQEPHWLDRLRRLFAWTVRHGGIFHLWCHSLDIERLGLWQALDRFLGEAVEWIPCERRLNNLQLVTRYCNGIPDAHAGFQIIR